MNLNEHRTINMEDYTRISDYDWKDQLLVDSLIDLAQSVQEIGIHKVINFARENNYFNVEPIFKHYAKKFFTYKFGIVEKRTLQPTKEEKRKLKIFFDAFIEVADELLDRDIYEEDIQRMLLEYEVTDNNTISQLFVAPNQNKLYKAAA